MNKYTENMKKNLIFTIYFWYLQTTNIQPRGLEINYKIK